MIESIILQNDLACAVQADDYRVILIAKHDADKLANAEYYMFQTNLRFQVFLFKHSFSENPILFYHLTRVQIDFNRFLYIICTAMLMTKHDANKSEHSES